MRRAFPRADAAVLAAPLMFLSIAGCGLIGPPADVVRDCARVEAVVKSGTQTTAATLNEGPQAIAARMSRLADTLDDEAATIENSELRRAVLGLAASYRQTAKATTPKQVPDAAQVRAAARRFDQVCGK